MDKPTSPNNPDENRAVTSKQGSSERKTRSWCYSLIWAAAWVGLAIGVSAGVNPLLDRSVHWDWMAGIGPTLFAAVALGYRRGWL